MLSEYFAFDITPDEKIESLPVLLKGYTPNLDKLPNFLMRLGPQVSVAVATHSFELYAELTRLTGRRKRNVLIHFSVSLPISMCLAHCQP
jgi:hypothetical protein